MGSDAIRRLPVGPILPLLAAGIALTALLEPRFLSSANILNIARTSAFLALVSCGQMLVIVSRGFDMSVGAVVAMTSVTSALAMNELYVLYPDWPVIVAIAGCSAGMAVGIGIGALNGFATAYLRASPFLVTLGMLSMASGAAYFLTSGIPVYGLPDSFTRSFARSIVLGVPLPVYIAGAVVLLVWLIQNRTRTGRHWYAIGGNPDAARRSAIPIERNLLCIYTLCGALASMCGVLLTARVGSGQATLGNEVVLQSIAACMLGGVALGGGVGKVWNVLMASVFIAVLGNALNLLRVDSKIQTILIGAFVLVAVALHQHRQGGER